MLTLGEKDKEVIRFFTNRLPLDNGRKLSTDGIRLDGNWMGGRGIAEWVVVGNRVKIQFNDLGSRSAQTVQRAIKKMVAPFDLLNGKGY